MRIEKKKLFLYTHDFRIPFIIIRGRKTDTRGAAEAGYNHVSQIVSKMVLNINFVKSKPMLS